MKKQLIIDGYNLLGALNSPGLIESQSLESARETLLMALFQYHLRSGYPLTVVFDAWRQRHPVPQTEHRSGVTIVFTRQGERADQVVQRLVRAQGQTCVVVSSDHEILETAQAHGAFVLRSEEFARKLFARDRSVASSRTGSPRLSAHDKCEDNERERRADKKGNPRKLPKKARQRLRTLRKF